jgi:hypothetical protein
VASSCERSNCPLICIKCGELLELSEQVFVACEELSYVTDKVKYETEGYAEDIEEFRMHICILARKIVGGSIILIRSMM